MNPLKIKAKGEMDSLKTRAIVTYGCLKIKLATQNGRPSSGYFDIKSPKYSDVTRFGDFGCGRTM